MERIDQKKVILNYLKKAYVGASVMDDEEMMIRLGRAIAAFSYDDLDNTPTWEQIVNSYCRFPPNN